MQEYSRAWSIGKSDRFKMNAETKKNNELANVSPGSYERHLKDKKDYPKWSMGGRIKEMDKTFSPSPQAYNIPSKVVEKQGKSFGVKLRSSLASGDLVPGPG